MLSVDGIPSENGIFQEVSQEVKNLQEDIKTGKFKNAYLLFGEEAYLKIQYKEKLIHALNPDDDTMNFTKYEGKGIEVREMIDLCETMLSLQIIVWSLWKIPDFLRINVMNLQII